MEIKFDKDPLTLEKYIYINATKILNTYIACDLVARSRTNSSKVTKLPKKILRIMKNNDKEKWIYSGYGIITLHCTGSSNFDNKFARNVIIYKVDNNSSSHADNRMNNILVVSKGPTYGINGNFCSQKKMFNIGFSKSNTKFCLSCIISSIILLIIVICLLMEKKSLIVILKLSLSNSTSLDRMSNGFSATESRNRSLNGNLHDFLVDYNSVDKSYIFNG